MATITVRLTSGHNVEFQIDTNREGPAFFVFGLPRSGSTLINEIVAEMAQFNKIPFTSVGDRFFNENIDVSDYHTDTDVLRIIRPGNAYGGFRAMVRPLINFPLCKASPKVLLVRDPRDALVSQYFADLYSHPIPQPRDGRDDVKRVMEDRRQAAVAMSIDDYVISRAEAAKFGMKDYRRLLRSTTLCLLRYEDYIFEKESLIRRVGRHFGWNVDDTLVSSIMAWADVRRDVSDPARLVRQIKPGDHLRQLQPRTIGVLNDILTEFMTPYGYSP
jgi:hypothetical protein